MRIFKRTATHETAIDPVQLAEDSAKASLAEQAQVDVDVSPAANGGWIANAVAYSGAGPFERLGTAQAHITASGRLLACHRA